MLIGCNHDRDVFIIGIDHDWDVFIIGIDHDWDVLCGEAPCIYLILVCYTDI